MPLPPLAEQEEIDEALKAVQDKYAVIAARLRTLRALFDTSLHQLMAGELRINDYDLPEPNAIAAE